MRKSELLVKKLVGRRRGSIRLWFSVLPEFPANKQHPGSSDVSGTFRNWFQKSLAELTKLTLQEELNFSAALCPNL